MAFRLRCAVSSLPFSAATGQLCVLDRPPSRLAKPLKLLGLPSAGSCAESWPPKKKPTFCERPRGASATDADAVPAKLLTHLRLLAVDSYGSWSLRRELTFRERVRGASATDIERRRRLLIFLFLVRRSPFDELPSPTSTSTSTSTATTTATTTSVTTNTTSSTITTTSTTATTSTTTVTTTTPIATTAASAATTRSNPAQPKKTKATTTTPAVANATHIAANATAIHTVAKATPTVANGTAGDNTSARQPNKTASKRGLLRVSPATTAAPAGSERFDCNHGYEHWESDLVGWSEPKKAWCCERYEVGCAADPSNSSRPFDCDSGSASGEEQWTASQKMWCCRHRRKGCVFDCAAGVDKWQRGWSEEKKAWCCALEDVACVHNCSDGFENWEAAWTIEKKSWCCKFKNRGCVIAQTVPVTPADVTLGDNTSAVAPVATGGANTTGAVVAWTACAFEEGTDYSGHDIANSQVESKDDCCSACVNHPGCTVGVLFEGRCFLKSSTAADKVVSEGRTACALAVGAEAGDVQALSDTGSSRSDPAPGDAEAPSSGETRQSAHSSVHAGLDKTDDDPALYNCDDEEEEGWSPAKGDFCCENEGKGCPPAGVQGASAVLGRGSSELARPGRAAPVAAGAASVAATLLSIGCCYRRGPRPQRGAPCPAAGGRSRGRPTSDCFWSAIAGARRSPAGYTELRPADADAPTSTADGL
mmetsp:Transcript_2559/g.6987  ORF Transcript_2559/g.6987 Transcript_2559/m.6987 type:complete len:707 (-) Transcript_2559:130-2250(-)